MGIFDKFTSQEDRKIKARTVFLGGDEREVGREFWPNPTQEKLIKTHPGPVDEIEKQGEPRHYFRYGSLEFRSLFSVVKMALANMLSSTAAVEAVKLEGESRPKTRSEILEEFVGMIKPLEEALVAKLTETLLKPGPCRETVISHTELTAFQKKKHAEEEREDLSAKLISVFGGDLNFLLTYWLRPEVFKQAVKNLPEGKTEAELLAERREDAKADLENHRRRIQEVRDYLKSLK
jgi:hypothetical protein